MSKWNGWARWVIIAIAVIAAIYGNFRNAAVLENDVYHLKADIAEIKQEISLLRQHLMKGTP